MVFGDGSKRDTLPGKPANWCTLDYESVRALAETNYEGDSHYGIDNWAKGLPASNLLNHALEHIFKLLDGDSSEAHIEHAMWNLGKLRWMAKHKPELIDLPRVRKAMKLGEHSEGQITGRIDIKVEGWTPDLRNLGDADSSMAPTESAPSANPEPTPSAEKSASRSGSVASAADAFGGTSPLVCKSKTTFGPFDVEYVCTRPEGHDGMHKCNEKQWPY